MATRSVGGMAAVRLSVLWALLVLLSHTGSAAREIISIDSMMRGTTMTPAQCSVRTDAVWASASGHGYCIRYYVSEAGGKGLQPVVHLSGDKLGVFSRKTGTFKPKRDAKDVDTRSLIRRVDAISRQARTSAIYLARVGLDGSSGFHGIRHTVLELQITNAALDAIKRRHRFTGFHLAGQSGGAGLIGGLLGLRRDVGCAVPGSGRLAILKKKDSRQPPLMQRFDPADGIPNIVRTSKARILVVTDPDDRTVKRKHQTSFVRQLRDAGGKVELFYIDSSDNKSHHGVTAYSAYVVGGCVRGLSHGDIAKGLAELVAKRLDRSAGN